MEVISNREEMIFKNENNGNVYYSIGLSKKNQDGSYENGYMNVRFKKDVELDNQTKIKINKAWIDFYVKEKRTYPYIFISEFEKVEDYKNLTTKTEVQEQFKYTDEDLPW